jgi:hypothetical protein
MKSYLNFTLTGSQLFPLWIAFFVFFMIPYYLLLGELTELNATEVSAGGPSQLFFLFLAIVLSAAFAFIFFLTKLVIQNIKYKGIPMICDYHPGKYIGIIISGLVLSIVTIGIYVPWFAKNLHRFFVHGADYNSHKFAFRGEGGKLFLIMTLTNFLLFLFVGIYLFSIMTSDIDLWIYELIITICLILNFCLIIKWMVDVRYKNYLIKCETGFLPAAGKIALELALAVITFGIYFPMAYIRLYRYLIEHTKSNVVDGTQILMGYDGELISDFLFIWGQILLTVVTIGFYYPWAFSRILRRVFTRTFLVTENVMPGK